MTYVEGFVIAVPTANRQKFIDHATLADSVFMEMGAVRILECWGDDVRDGKLTDFRRAVQAKDDESVVFSWIEWPDKATRDAAAPRLEALMKTDDRFSPEKNPMPFDGARLIYGGFSPVVTLEKPRTNQPTEATTSSAAALGTPTAPKAIAAVTGTAAARTSSRVVAPLPSTLPASRCAGRTTVTSTSATLVDFSTATPVATPMPPRSRAR